MRINNDIDMLNYYEHIVSKNVHGWFYPLDILIMFNLLRNNVNELKGDICELGVAQGKSAILLSLMRSENENFYMYDLDPQDAPKNVAQYGNEKRTKFTSMDLMNLDKSDVVFENKLKLLHIDACHYHTALLKDINNFHEHVCDNGIIVIDDINDAEFPGVNTAVAEFCLTNPQWKMFAIGHNKAYLAKEQYVRSYIKFIIKHFRDQLNYKNFRFNEVLGVDMIILTTREPVSDEILESYLQDKFVLNYV